jgi:hypothetical protein
MNNKLLNCLIAGAFASTLVLASPALARGGGGGMGGGGHAGGMGGGMHGGMGGGMHGGMGGGMHVGGMGGWMHFGGMFAYAAAYDSCWRRMWTPYGWQWVSVCDDFGY